MIDEKIVKLFGWDSNPFTFRILPELFVGYNGEIKGIVEGLTSGDKFSLLMGPTGSGKTTLLKHVKDSFPGFKYTFYLPKPPKDPDDWMMIFGRFIKPGFFKSLFSKNNGVNIYNLSEKVNERLGNDRFLLFVDECHEASIESLEWLRSLVDNIDNLSIIMAGLPVFENMLKSNLETFNRRINKKTELGNLTKPETRELVKKRIESVGGDDIKPFTSGTIEYIYQTTGGFPREVIRMCDELTNKAMKSNISTIDTDFLKENDAPASRVSMDTIDSLPERQKLILDVLSHGGDFTPSEIVRKLDDEVYKNRDNAIRSVNNLLRRLMKDGFVDRKRVGKTYKYVLASKFKTLMVEA
ncbi:AAA family ATPase [Candidatus Aenigmatarchaeota archaeon]